MYSLNRIIRTVSLIALTLGCFGLSPQARAVDPPPDGVYPNQTTAQGDDAPFSLNAPASGIIWSFTGSLNTARALHTATLLPNGMVLVAGGAFDSLASAELYDSASESWSFTGSLNAGREFHTATLLPNGMVLVAGGFDSNFASLASAELYDPASGTWTATDSLNTGRVSYTATLLPNGKVLVAGGFNGSHLASAELYDPVRGNWTAAGSLNIARDSHTAALLPNGMVLIAGGVGIDGSFGSLASAELYDPASGSWSFTGSLNTARTSHTATLLPKRDGPCCSGT